MNRKQIARELIGLANRLVGADKPLRIKRTRRIAPGEYEIIRSDGLKLSLSKDEYERNLWWLSDPKDFNAPREDVYSVRQAKKVALEWGV